MLIFFFFFSAFDFLMLFDSRDTKGLRTRLTVKLSRVYIFPWIPRMKIIDILCTIFIFIEKKKIELFFTEIFVDKFLFFFWNDHTSIDSRIERVKINNNHFQLQTNTLFELYFLLGRYYRSIVDNFYSREFICHRFILSSLSICVKILLLEYYFFTAFKVKIEPINGSVGIIPFIKWISWE